MPLIDLKTEDLYACLDSNSSVVVCFWSPDGEPSRMLMPVLEDLSTKYPAIRFVRVSVHDLPALAEEFEIAETPTLLFFKDAMLETAHKGAVSARQLQDLLSYIR